MLRDPDSDETHMNSGDNISYLSTGALSSLDDLKLLELRAAVDREARRRGLNFHVGEIGEKLAIDVFKSRPDLPVLAPAPRGTKNIDAISREGNRYSIKTLQRAKKTGTIYPDSSDNTRILFEFILIVLLREDFTLERIVEINWQQFCAIRSWDKRMNAWYIGGSRRALNAGRQIYPKEDPSTGNPIACQEVEILTSN